MQMVWVTTTQRGSALSTRKKVGLCLPVVSDIVALLAVRRGWLLHCPPHSSGPFYQFVQFVTLLHIY